MSDLRAMAELTVIQVTQCTVGIFRGKRTQSSHTILVDDDTWILACLLVMGDRRGCLQMQRSGCYPMHWDTCTLVLQQERGHYRPC